MDINEDFLKATLEKVFKTPSPTGYSKEVTFLLENILKNLGYNPRVMNKGTIEVFVKGESSFKTVSTSAHADTLGLMVRSIKADGHLILTNLGGPIIPTLDGEYCEIMTRGGKRFSGTILCESRSAHVFKDATKERTLDNLIVRIDEQVNSKEEVLNLGIDNGDFVFIDPKFTITKSGFVKSRFIDDKASVGVLLSILEYFSIHKEKPHFDTFFYFVCYEEVGHGASVIDPKISEFVTVDMGCVGLDLAGSEEKVSICCKDSAGPYDFDLTNHLIDLAKENKIAYVRDIFPFYSSDISAATRSGHDFKGALIGQGVDASHGMERTHINGIKETIKLLYAYLTR